MVLTNNGSGVFGFNGNYTVGVAPQCVTAADVNGDGKVDLISANFSGNSLTVLTNDGSGGFVLASTLNVGISPISVVAADVNGDGKLDLISANYGVNGNGGTLTVLTNNGNGSFVLASTFNAIRPQSIVAADVNGDGKLDFISANASGTYSDALSVFTNNIAFPPPASTPPLNINFQSNCLIVTWPSESAGWSLQQSPDLTTHWGPSGYSGYTISDDGINKHSSSHRCREICSSG